MNDTVGERTIYHPGYFGKIISYSVVTTRPTSTTARLRFAAIRLQFDCSLTTLYTTIRRLTTSSRQV